MCSLAAARIRKLESNAAPPLFSLFAALEVFASGHVIFRSLGLCVHRWCSHMAAELKASR
jgi:hypothetical protein